MHFSISRRFLDHLFFLLDLSCAASFNSLFPLLFCSKPLSFQILNFPNVRHNLIPSLIQSLSSSFSLCSLRSISSLYVLKILLPDVQPVFVSSQLLLLLLYLVRIPLEINCSELISFLPLELSFCSLIERRNGRLFDCRERQ